MTRTRVGPAATLRVRICPTLAPGGAGEGGAEHHRRDGRAGVRGGIRGGEPVARAQPVGVEGMRAQAPRHVGLPVVLHGTGLDGLDVR